MRNRTLVAVVGLVASLWLLLWAVPASAHTDFAASSPADGDVLAEPVTEVIVVFTKPVTLIGDGFEILLPTGEIVIPTAVSDDDTTWILTTPETIAGGEGAVRFTVGAVDDGHEFGGGFAFTVTAPAPQTTTAPSTTSRSTTSPSTTSPSTTATLPTTDASSTSVPLSTNEFLRENRQGSSPLLGGAARIGGFVSSLLLIGAVAFAFICWRPSKDDITENATFDDATHQAIDDEGAAGPEDAEPDLLEAFALVGGLVLVVSAIAELSALSSTFGLGWDDLLSETRLRGAGARLLAGAMFVYAPMATGTLRRMVMKAAVPVAALSFGLDGHSVSEGPRFVHAVVNFSHVLAAGIWFGGLLFLWLTLRQRAGENDAQRSVVMASRFSNLATVALVPVLVGGVVMAVLILDQWGDLTGTRWGQLLILKVLIVVVALGFGGLNRFVLLPRFRTMKPSGSEHPDALASFGRAVGIEAGLLIAATVVAAVLVAASTT